MTYKLAACLLLVAVAGALSAAPAQAVMLTFSEPDFEWSATGGPATPYHIWTTGDYWRQNFVGTGLGSAAAMTLDLEVDDAASETLNLDVFLNSSNVGSFALNPGDLGLQSYNFNFAPVIGDSYLLEIVASNTLSPGVGSYSIFLDNDLSKATLAAVPEPGSMALLGLGLAGAIGARRKRRSR